MMFFTIILVLFILLILLSISNTLIAFALRLVTRENFKENILIIPSLLSLLLWISAYTVALNYIPYKTGTNIIDSIFISLFKVSSFDKYAHNLVIPMIILFIITLLLQSVALLAVNLDYNMLFNKFRYSSKGKYTYIRRRITRIKRRFIHDDGSELICGSMPTDMKVVDEKYELNLINAFVCSLFIFSLLFFIYILFFWFGTLIGKKII